MQATIEIKNATPEEEKVLTRFGFVVGETYTRLPNSAELRAMVDHHIKMTELESIKLP